LLLVLSVRQLAPEILFRLPRRNPILWVLILCLYPIVSVYPQGVIYRAFLVHRYSVLFRSPVVLIVASAVAFGYMHIVFRNEWAIGLSALAGLLFAARYLQTGSLLVSSFEHALYGNLIFSVGMGSYLYHGVLPRAG